MFIKILLTALFFLLNFLLYKKLQRKKMFKFKKNELFILLAIILLFMAYFSFNSKSSINPKILIVNLIYSTALVVFYFIFKVIKSLMTKRYEKFDNNFVKNYIKILDFIEKKLIFILITVFQVLVIWDPTVIEGMNF